MGIANGQLQNPEVFLMEVLKILFLLWRIIHLYLPQIWSCGKLNKLEQEIFSEEDRMQE